MQKRQPDKVELVDQLCYANRENDRIDAARHLSAFISDPAVLEQLCVTANRNIDHRLREALIQSLKEDGDRANLYFYYCAVYSSNPATRRWSLVNLALMECRWAKDAVLMGLQDGSQSIRFAAALNAGLYDDNEILDALDDVFAEQEVDYFMAHA